MFLLPRKMRREWLTGPLAVILLAPTLLTGLAARADELQDYAQQCDAAVSATVPHFNCDAGTEVPGQGSVFAPASAICDEPNRLDKQCDPGSRFQVLTRNDDAYILAHCRKKGQAPGRFGDIAVIQYGRKNGATCFYQALGDLPGEVEPPSKGGGSNPSPGAWSGPWFSPSSTAHIGCGGCHDNGPFIRSPYLNQIEGPNAIPGKDDPSFNRNQPYAFVGKDFASWKAFKVDAENECTSCHRLGANNVPVNTFPCSHVDGGNRADLCGTALDFAERATSATEISEEDARPSHKAFPPSVSSPMWMPPHQVPFDQNHANSAKAIHDCALRLHVAGRVPKDTKPLPLNPPPDSPGCHITQFAGPLRSHSIDLSPVYHLLLGR